MIEFNGYLTGAAENGWLRINKVSTFNIFFVSSFLVLAPILYWFIITEQRLMSVVIAIAIFLFPSIPLLRSKKELREFLPKNIVIDDDYIRCKSDKQGEMKRICDVKKVIDYGEFYYIAFPAGKMSTNFICQKDLLVKGTLKDFEKLFEGKIKRKY